MKTVVETTGNFQIMGDRKGEMVHAFRPSVVESTAFLQHALSKEPPTARVLGKVSGEVTDADLAAHIKDGGKVDEFVEAYKVEGEKPAKAAAKPAK